jgi:two-component system, chemotaxis family, protein-glutamate methylesterase/glutaminase
MKALPSHVPASPDEDVTGLSCPECFGVLGVTAEGSQGTLRFRCRVGHAYTADEVLAGKERNLEEHLWAAMTRVEEIAACLHELVATGRAGDRAVDYAARAQDCDRQRQLLMEAIATRAVAGVDPEAIREPDAD